MMTQSYTCGPSRQLGAGKVPGMGSRRVILTKPHARRPRFSTRGVPVRAVNASDEQQDREKPFRHEFPMDSMQTSLSSVPTGGMYALTAALAGGAAALGFFAGGKLPEGVRGAAAPVAAVAGAAMGGLGGRSLIEKRRTAAPVELYNKLHGMDDPEGLTREDVDALGEKYGVNMAQDMVMDLQRIYDQYLASVIPPGDMPLAGDEPQRIRRFIDALGLSDEDAAPVHIDVARRFARSRMETGNRDAAFGELRAVQKVIYVTNLVFGEMRARYLCPWGRVFGMTDAQVFVALRDNARMLFQSHLEAQGGTVQADRQALQQLRQFQRRINLNDDVTAELVQEATRAHVEGLLDKAVECIKRRQRVKDYTDAMTAVAEIVQYNRTMTALSQEDQSEVPEEEQLICGLGAVTVQGGRYRESAAAKDCRDLLRIWLAESIERDGALSQDTESAFEELGTTLCLTASQKDDIQSGVVSEVYQTLLRAEVQSGRLEAAESPAAVLNDICQKLRYNVEAATALHRELYKNKLAGLLEKKALTDDDVADLERARRMLCVPEADYHLAHKEACGGLFRKTLEWAMAAGMDAFGADEIQEVKKAMHDVRLSEDVAKELLDEVGRRELLKFITASRMKRQPLDRAKELKRMIFFSNMVLAPLLEAMGLSEAAKKKKGEEELAKLMEEAVAAAKKEEEEEAEKEVEAEAEPEKEAEKDLEAEAEAEAEKEAEAVEVVEARVEAPDAEVVEAKPEDAAAEVVEATVAEAEPAKSEEEQEEEEQAEEQVVSSLAKAQAAVKDEAATTMTTESGEEVKMRGQKEITLAKDLDVRDRSDIYRNYLMYCMTGDVVQLPMGGTIVMERDASEFARLSMLGELLGMTQMEVMQVHNDLSEQAFRSQVQSIMADGVLTKEKSDKLEEMRKSMGLSEESAKKILKGIQNQRLIGNLDTLKAQGELTLEKVMDLKEQGVEVETFLSEDMRVNLYRSEATSRITSGQPDLDETFLFETLPADLGLPAEKCNKAMREFAADKKRSMFIQAISELRQKKAQEAVASLNNIVSCTKVLKDTAPEQWQDRDELKDLFAMYVAQVANDAHRAEVAGILGLSEEDASAVQAAVEGGSIRVEDERSAKSFI